MMQNTVTTGFKFVEHMDYYKHENKSKRILIVDDDLEFRLILSELLVGLGYSISTAKDGKAALRCLSMMEDLPQLILLDSHMPEAGGKEFFKLRKRMHALTHIPVIVISGDMAATDEYKHDACACVLKPLDRLEIIDVVASKLSLA